MKYQIRRGVFETNSSSVHSLTMCPKDQFEKWVNGELYFQRYSCKFMTDKEVASYLNDREVICDDKEEWDEARRDYDIYTFEEFPSSDEVEYFEENYTTPGGEEIVAFGYSGRS